ncbi:hypothetical protein B0H14DRAFT_2582738 [Mycena olivaceomarginata]|nr:hypothetical protein B0H14DRAFT_2582738 [Mycena olivaceomarginata]
MAWHGVNGGVGGQWRALSPGVGECGARVLGLWQGTRSHRGQAHSQEFGWNEPGSGGAGGRSRQSTPVGKQVGGVIAYKSTPGEASRWLLSGWLPRTAPILVGAEESRADGYLRGIASVVSDDTGGRSGCGGSLRARRKELAGVIARAIGPPRQLRVAKPVRFPMSRPVASQSHPVVSPRHKEPETQNTKQASRNSGRGEESRERDLSINKDAKSLDGDANKMIGVLRTSRASVADSQSKFLENRREVESTNPEKAKRIKRN